ncbi:MAG: isoleucine--tRNA ligase [archaeon]
MPENYNPVQFEHEILTFWAKKGIYEKQKKLYANSKKQWSFIDGPMTANNPMGVHHAWGRTLKDIYLRWHAAQRYNIRRQNGFDTQGLWIEREVEKELGFKRGKKDIEEYGIGKFVEKCKDRVRRMSAKQTEQSIRLGQWMDWDDSYYTHTDKANEYKWNFLKFCHEKGWIYKGKDVIPWCPRCSTAESKHAIVTEGYFEVEHTSMFMQFPLSGKKDEFFLVWTTTPWTVPADVAIAVNPELKYVRVKQGGRHYWLAESRLSVLKGEYKIEEHKRGSQLEGMRYEMPYRELEAQKGAAHRVVVWDLVSGEDGTGIVHIAPGCGPEDYALGKKEKLTAPSPLNEEGIFMEGYDWLVCEHVSAANPEVIKDLQKRGFIYKLEQIKHRYPHCTRCGTELIFRLVDEWYIAVDDMRPKLIAENKKIKWVPPQGQRYEEDWLNNMSDWLISRKRYYGLPLPIWECSCGHFEVIGSVAELKKKAVEGFSKLKELHRPWVDEVKIKCPKCGKAVSRVKDTGDVWLDAGIVPFFTLDYLTNKKYFDKWYPADFITECGPGQYRCWFYSMILHGVFLTGKAPTRSVMTNEMVKGEDGKEMHKSWGNAIWFDEAAEKVGTDVMRWKYSTQDISKELWFGWRGLEEQKKNLNVLWNLANYLQVGFGKGFKPSQPKANSPADRWILSKLESLKKSVTANLEALQPHLAALELQDFFLNTFSREYIHFVRDILSEEGKDRDVALQVMYKVMLEILALLSPFIPFTTEKIYQDVFRRFQKLESIHLLEWPEFEIKKVDEKLEAEIAVVQAVTSDVFALREKLQRSVRWPIKSLMVVTEDHDIKSGVEKQKELIRTLANVNSIQLTHKLEGIKHAVKPNHSTVAPKAKKDTTFVIAHLASLSPESILQRLRKDKKIVVKDIELTEADFIIEEKLPAGVVGQQVGNYSIYLETAETRDMQASGFARELVRAVQALRKKAGLKKPDRIKLTVYVDPELENMLAPSLREIKEKVGARDIEFAGQTEVNKRGHKEHIHVRNKVLQFSFDVA